MDNSAREIVFTKHSEARNLAEMVDEGIREDYVNKPNGCNFCDGARQALAEAKELAPLAGEMLAKIKRAGRGKKYDCLIGLSGGVDSAYALQSAKALGLRPLAFSVDNGWNDPKADENIFNLVESLNVPFEKHVIDWKLFGDLQAAFMVAGQKNIEIPTDHILMAVSLDLANRYGIKHILSGGNVASESIMPRSWGYQPRDLVHIKAIYRWHKKKRLTGLPMCGILKWNWYKWVKGIETVYLLDYFDYNRELAKDILIKNYKYQDVGEKHEENIFTRWFQSFYLFEKFGIDKRKAHYSSLIVAGQMTREEALFRLEAMPVYPQLGIERKVMRYLARDYTDFPTDEKLYERVSATIKLIRKICKS